MRGARAVPVELKAVRKTDPFDSYSILKPEAEVFRLARPNRRPMMLAVALAIVLISLAGSYPSGFVTSIARLFQSPRVNVTKDATTALRQGRTESVEVKPAAKPSPTSSGAEGGHQKENEKKRTRRSVAKAADLKPPPFSITP